MSALDCIGGSISERLHDSLPVFAPACASRISPLGRRGRFRVLFLLAFAVSRLSPLWGRGRFRLFWRHAASTAWGPRSLSLVLAYGSRALRLFAAIRTLLLRGRAIARTPNGGQVGGRAAGQMT